MATRKEQERAPGRRAPGRAPGVFRSAGNPLYRTDPATGNLVLVSEQELAAPPVTQAPLPPAPFVEPPVQAQPEPEPEPAPARASPLEQVFAADAGDAVSGEASSPSDSASLGLSASQAAALGETGKGVATFGLMGANPALGLAGLGLMGLASLAQSQQSTESPVVGWENTTDIATLASQIGEQTDNVEALDTPTDPDIGSVDAPSVGVGESTNSADAIGDAVGGPTGGGLGSAPDASASAPGSADGGDGTGDGSGGGSSGGGDAGAAGASGSADGGDGSGDGSGGADGDGGGFADGGLVTADRLRGPNPPGPDDGSAPLDEGEFVVNAQATAQARPLLEQINAMGGGQGATEMQTMRWFAENVLVRTPEGQQFALELQQALPVIEQAIAQRPDAREVLQHIVGAFVQPAAEAVRRGDHAGAVRIYGEMGIYAAQLAAEAELDPEIEQLLEEFAQDSAEVAHDGELASLASATGGELVHPGAQVANQPGSRLGRIFVGD